MAGWAPGCGWGAWIWMSSAGGAAWTLAARPSPLVARGAAFAAAGAAFFAAGFAAFVMVWPL